MISILVNLIFLLVLVFIQISFLATWTFPINSLNLVLSLVIFLTVIINYQRGIIWALGGGLLLDIYFSNLFGVTTFSLFFVAVGINFLFNNFFTNRSLYSLLILGFIGTIGYNLITLGFKLLAGIFGFSMVDLGFDPWIIIFWQPFLNLIILTIIFFTYYISIGRLKNIFLFHPTSYEIKGKF